MTKTKRGHFGKNNPKSKLTEQDVRIIRKLYKYGNFTQQQLADVWEVSLTTIHCLLARKTWKEVK